MGSFALSQKEWLFGLLLVSAALAFENVIHYLILRLMRKQNADTSRRGMGLQRFLAGPARAVLFAIGIRIGLPYLPVIPTHALDSTEQFLESIIVLLLGWLAIGGVYVFEAFTLKRFDTTLADNLRARRVHTQMQFFRRLIIAIVVLLDSGVFLWSLHEPRLWNYGTGLLASAGLASLVLAAAGKSTASNLIAGMQIAFTDPIRIDDVVVIQGEWGRIEEITSTYVVLKIWDERRLVVPLSYFIEQPFENWTRRRGELLGTAFLYLDYTIPMDPLRAELQRVVEQTPLWDRRVCLLQVTNLTDRAMELRCLVSAASSSQCFDLRCFVREKMITFIQDKFPRALPSLRFEMREANEAHPLAANNDASESVMNYRS